MASLLNKVAPNHKLVVTVRRKAERQALFLIVVERVHLWSHHLCELVFAIDAVDSYFVSDVILRHVQVDCHVAITTRSGEVHFLIRLTCREKHC